MWFVGAYFWSDRHLLHGESTGHGDGRSSTLTSTNAIYDARRRLGRFFVVGKAFVDQKDRRKTRYGSTTMVEPPSSFIR